jgi:hypothetical protein
MDPDVQRRAQGERIVRYFVETGYFRRDDDGELRLVEGAREPDLSVISDRRGHVIPAIEDYLSAIAHAPPPEVDTDLPTAG